MQGYLLILRKSREPLYELLWKCFPAYHCPQYTHISELWWIITYNGSIFSCVGSISGLDLLAHVGNFSTHATLQKSKVQVEMRFSDFVSQGFLWYNEKSPFKVILKAKYLGV